MNSGNSIQCMTLLHIVVNKHEAAQTMYWSLLKFNTTAESYKIIM